MIYKLHKINNNNVEQIWTLTLKDNSFVVVWGQKDGKLQSKTTTISEGKNIGRSNETTPEQQAKMEAEKLIRKQIEIKSYTWIDRPVNLTTISKEAHTTHMDVPQPMLANDALLPQHNKKVFAQSLIAVQPKIDGNRCLYNLKTKKLYSRTRKEILSLPHLSAFIDKACKSIDADWVDGELYSDKLTFNDIQSIIRQKHSLMTHEDIEFAKTIGINVFDVISKHNQEKRIDVVNRVVNNDNVKVVKTEIISPADLQKYHDKYVEEGYEGIIIRLLNGVYEHKRSKYLFKYKQFIDEEYKVVGFTSEKHDKTKMGAAILQFDKNTTFKARPKMTEKEKAFIFENQKDYIGRMATIKFQRYDAKTGVPIFGALIKFRAENDIDKK